MVLNRKNAGPAPAAPLNPNYMKSTAAALVAPISSKGQSQQCKVVHLDLNIPSIPNGNGSNLKTKLPNIVQNAGASIVSSQGKLCEKGQID